MPKSQTVPLAEFTYGLLLGIHTQRIDQPAIGQRRLVRLKVGVSGQMLLIPTGVYHAGRLATKTHGRWGSTQQRMGEGNGYCPAAPASGWPSGDSSWLKHSIQVDVGNHWDSQSQTQTEGKPVTDASLSWTP